MGQINERSYQSFGLRGNEAILNLVLNLDV